MKFKALSFRQPWADLVLEGRKSLDLRTWSTKYRGTLAVYASSEIEREACKAHGMDPSALSTGVVIGFVDLVDIVKLSAEEYARRQSQHLNGRNFKNGLFGWEFANPRPLEKPVPARGHLKLFNVNLPDHSILQKEVAVKHAEPAKDEPTHREFELRVVPNGAGYKLAFAQLEVKAKDAAAFAYRPFPAQMRVHVELSQDTLRSIADQILETLKANGYKPTDLSASRRQPFRLSEQTAIRLGLLFLAVKPITKPARIEAISHGIRMMTGEELYYWYSKCTAGPSTERAQKALRTLLAEE